MGNTRNMQTNNQNNANASNRYNSQPLTLNAPAAAAVFAADGCRCLLTSGAAGGAVSAGRSRGLEIRITYFDTYLPYSRDFIHTAEPTAKKEIRRMERRLLAADSPAEFMTANMPGMKGGRRAPTTFSWRDGQTRQGACIPKLPKPEYALAWNQQPFPP